MPLDLSPETGMKRFRTRSQGRFQVAEVLQGHESLRQYPHTVLQKLLFMWPRKTQDSCVVVIEVEHTAELSQSLPLNTCYTPFKATEDRIEEIGVEEATCETWTEFLDYSVLALIQRNSDAGDCFRELAAQHDMTFTLENSYLEDLLKVSYFCLGFMS